ncbi:hypothetical protein AAC387_Pa01g2614 [Persea americana]
MCHLPESPPVLSTPQRSRSRGKFGLPDLQKLGPSQNKGSLVRIIVIETVTGEESIKDPNLVAVLDRKPQNPQTTPSRSSRKKSHRRRRVT